MACVQGPSEAPLRPPRVCLSARGGEQLGPGGQARETTGKGEDSGRRAREKTKGADPESGKEAKEK